MQPPVLGILPGGWQRIFFRALAKKSVDRYPSCGAFVKDLMDATSEIEKDDRRELLGIMHMGGEVPMPPIVSRAGDETIMEPSSPSIMVARRKNKGGLVAASILILGAAGIGGWFVLKGGMRVVVSSDPIKATVFVNDKKMEGETPIPLPLKPGDKVRIEHKGFEPLEFDFKAGDKPEPKLRAKVSEIILKSDPGGATVTLDTEQKGPTPVKVSWNQGTKHTLSLKKDELIFNRDYLVGDLPDDAPIQLKPADSTPVDPNAPATLKLAGGFPVRVRIDGKDAGELTSSSKMTLPDGPHKLELSNASVFYRDSRSITAKGGQVIAINVPGTARITVETFPGADKVAIDGTPTGVDSDGNSSITVSRGRHVITVKGIKQAVNITGDQPVKFKI
ncbi:MAG: PEGA domain-containing protein [Holophagaceae bacterium]|nr:PEGA domain-containing protein [Holophagaceae bacterium]